MKALVLSGGGCHGAYQVGVLKYLLGIKHNQYDIFTGISVGAINAAFLAQFNCENSGVDELENLWLNLNNSKVKSFHFPPYLSAFWNRSIYSTKPLRKILETHINPNCLSDSGKLLRIGAVSLTTGQYGQWTEKDKDIINGVMASSAFPGFFENIDAKNEHWADGGVRNVTPLKDAIDAGATEIDVVLAQHSGVGNKSGTFNTIDTLLRSLTIMMDEVFINDLKVCAFKNTIDGYKKIGLTTYTPSKEFYGNPLDFNPANIRYEIEMGYNDGKNKEISK